MLIVAGLALSACGGTSSTSSADKPAVVEPVDGTDVSRITLTEKAAQRLDIRTAAVEKNGAGLVIPYSAVFYSPTGETWAYVSTAPLTFVRQQIVVDSIEGDKAILSTGLAPGTEVAIVGVAELFGAESGLGQ
jgi:hypothetical protein